MPKSATIEERFWEKVDRTGDCWLWTAYTDRYGYGQFQLPGSGAIRAHRWAYEHFVGAIPAGLTIDHLCRVRACVNPSHLEPVTNRENLMRSPLTHAAVNARKTHCGRGHAFSPTNTRVLANGGRVCRACQTEWARAKRSAS